MIRYESYTFAEDSFRMFVQQGRRGLNSAFYYVLTTLICFTGIASLSAYLYQNFSFDLKDINQTLILTLIPFSAVIFFILFNTRLLHKRPIASLFNIFNHFRWSRFLIGLIFWSTLLIATDVFNAFIFHEDYKLSLNKENFLQLCIISLSLFPIQTLAEELFFRSYLTQGLSNIFSKSIFPIILSSFIFMGAHMMNPETEKYGLILMSFYYLCSAFFLGILTELDDGIEQSYGIHTATNIYGAVIVGYEGSAIQTESVWTIQNMNAFMMVLFSILIMVIYYFMAHRFWKIRKFNYLIKEYELENVQEKV